MGLLDKIKGILFDEEEVEVPVDDTELPERTPKKQAKPEARGFRDYRGEDEVQEENPIVEVKVPKEEVVERVVQPQEVQMPVQQAAPKGFNLQEDFDMDDFPVRSRGYEEITQEYRVESQVIRQPERIESRIDRNREPRKDYKELAKVDTSTRKNEEVKDYKKIVSENKETTFKKPFKVTPIISPVYGILDKNYTADDITERREQINNINNGITKTRTFGPVSYNDKPLPKGTGKILKNNSINDELVELNSTINEMMEDVKLEETREIEIRRTEIKVSEPTEVSAAVIQEVRRPVVVKDSVEDKFDDTEEIIMTPDYDNFDTTSIEKQYIGNNNIEDAFESTGEFNKISEFDKSEEEAPVSIEDIINNRDKLDEEEDHLDDTIETDLFNLIDSMYKHDDEDESEDSED